MDQFVGQIMVTGFNFAPQGWALCQGQLMPISQNTTLFSLLGTFFGGDGRSTFGLPNLQGAMAICMGQGAGLPDYTIGQAAGEQNVTLLTSQMPMHTHVLQGLNQAASTTSPVGASFGIGGRHPLEYYVAPPSPAQPATMNVQALPVTGGSQPHNNMMPSVALNFCIALVGVYPARQ